MKTKLRAAILISLISVVGLTILGPSNIKSLAFERNLLCAEVFLDLDNDRWEERLTLTRESDGYEVSDSPGQFYRILIDTIISKKDSNSGWKRVFDSSEHSVMQYFCGDLFEKDRAILRLENRNGNRYPELYFAEWNGNCDPEGVVIIEYLENKYQVLLRAPLGFMEFRDLDNDGLEELCGITTFSHMAGIYEPAFLVAYTFKDNKYVSSYEMTKQLHEERLDKYEAEFSANRDIQSLLWLLGFCAVGDFLDGEKELIAENEDLVLKHGLSLKGAYEALNDIYKLYLTSCERVRAGKWEVGPYAEPEEP